MLWVESQVTAVSLYRLEDLPTHSRQQCVAGTSFPSRNYLFTPDSQRTSRTQVVAPWKQPIRRAFHVLKQLPGERKKV